MRFSFRFRLAQLFIAGLFFASRVPAQQGATPTEPAIHLDVDRVNVGVAVTDSRGQFVTGLRRTDFHLFDNGAEQPVTDFLSTEDPAQVLLLIEAGPAVYLLEGGHLAAVQTLLEGLGPTDRVAIARYNEGAEPILDFTTDKRIASAALDGLRFNVGFAQLNLASSIATALDWLTAVPGKKSLVVLSTGVDTSPASATQTLLARLRTTDVRLLLISLGAELRNAQPTGKKQAKKSETIQAKDEAVAEAFAHADDELRAIAEADGGRVYFPRSSKDFAGVFAEIAQLVRHEYSLAFIPPTRDAKLHTIDVRITDSSNSSEVSPVLAYRIDHRQAYLAPR
ncbi:MAG TPA: VWA domain-containing protein [Candidatus Methylomirabilis sp.]|nr:VWA domain-containing protein [Candidatus Methylomirabilis sp.]